MFGRVLEVLMLVLVQVSQHDNMFEFVTRVQKITVGPSSV